MGHLANISIVLEGAKDHQIHRQVTLTTRSYVQLHHPEQMPNPINLKSESTVTRSLPDSFSKLGC